jgi:hypothetical protein
MEFVPSDTYIVMGHGKEPDVSLEEEHDFLQRVLHKITRRLV